MIYEFGRTIMHLYKSTRHFFRAMFCKHYFTEAHGVPECELMGGTLGHRKCVYWTCPKLKGADDED